jgi:hypothetical protein
MSLYTGHRRHLKLTPEGLNHDRMCRGQLTWPEHEYSSQGRRDLIRSGWQPTWKQEHLIMELIWTAVTPAVGYLTKQHHGLVATDMEMSCQTHQNRRRSKNSDLVLTLTIVQGESL